ncbi:MAG: type IVB secretion system protein IcmH/DotU [Pseudomonas sp.]
MSMDTHLQQDEKTILVNAHGERPHQETLTDVAHPPRYEELEQRMIFAASRDPQERFNIGINPLVSAAAPLVSMLVRVKAEAEMPKIDTLRDTFKAHLQHFVDKARDAGLNESEIRTAHYLLCTVSDETVATTVWGNEGRWSDHGLLNELHQQSSGGEKFFELVDLVGRDPIRNLATMELMFICLCLGFEGKYRLQTRGMIELNNVRDSLYRQIRHVRGDVPRELSPQWEGLRAPRQRVVRIVPGWLLLAISATCLLVMFSGFAFVLGEKREAVLRLYQPLASSVVQPHP